MTQNNRVETRVTKRVLDLRTGKTQLYVAYAPRTKTALASIRSDALPIPKNTIQITSIKPVSYAKRKRPKPTPPIIIIHRGPRR